MTITSSSLTLSGQRRGRPRVSERSTSVSTWLPTREHTKLLQMAKQRGVSVSSVLRELATKATTER